jgi:predicted DNA-binding transcriptional regulator AlpA
MNLNTKPSNESLSSIAQIKDEVIQKTQLLRIEEVCELTTLGKSTINLWVAQGKFPKPIHLSSTIKVWRLGDIVLWINSQMIGETNEKQ